MSKIPVGQINPANLWGKPLPGAARTTGRAQPIEDDEPVVGADSELDNVDDPDDDALREEEENGEDTEDTPEVTNETDGDPEEDEEDGDDELESEAGDEDDVDLVSDKRSSAVEDDVDEDVTEGATTMAEKKSGADHIRDEIKRRRASGDSLRGVDILAALAKKKVTVSAAQVSQLLKKEGVTSGRAGRPAAAAATADGEKSRAAAKSKKSGTAPAPAPRAAPKAASTLKPLAAGASGMPMAQLEAASAFLETCDGCYDTAVEILATHNRLGQMYGKVSN